MLALNIRRLPSWVLSREQHKARWGVHPDYVPVPMSSAEEVCERSFPDWRLSGFLQNGLYPVDFWLRVESLVEDFLGFADRFTDVDDERRQQIAAIGPVNQNEYEHDVWAWLTPETGGAALRGQPGVEQRREARLRRPARASARLRMPAYEVLAVSVPAAMPAKLLGAYIDLPKTGLTAGVLHAPRHGLGARAASRRRPRSRSSTSPSPDRAGRGRSA